jgi:hypothetical protein
MMAATGAEQAWSGVSPQIWPDLWILSFPMTHARPTDHPALDFSPALLGCAQAEPTDPRQACCA